MWGRTLSVFSAGRLGGSSARWGGRGVAHVYLRHRIHLVAVGKAAFNAAAAFLCLHKLVEIFSMHFMRSFWLGISGAWVGEELAGWAWQFWTDPSPGGPSSSAAIPSLPGRPQHGPQRCGPRRLPTGHYTDQTIFFFKQLLSTSTFTHRKTCPF